MALLVAVLLLALTARGQNDDADADDYFHPEASLTGIAQQWQSHPLKVKVLYPKAQVRNLAMAFCRQFPQYKSNSCMADYLQHPGEVKWEERHYYVDEDVRHGYVKCDMGGQFDYMTNVCYWRRPNGHQLVGVLMQVGHEGERCSNLLLFYDYDPQTQLMTPDTTVFNAVQKVLRSHRESNFITLPKEGKDIEVTAVYWTEADDFVYDEYKLVWTNNGFREVEAN